MQVKESNGRETVYVGGRAETQDIEGNDCTTFGLNDIELDREIQKICALKGVNYREGLRLFTQSKLDEEGRQEIETARAEYAEQESKVVKHALDTNDENECWQMVEDLCAKDKTVTFKNKFKLYSQLLEKRNAGMELKQMLKRYNNIDTVETMISIINGED